MSSARNIAYLVELTERATLDLDAIYEYIGAGGSSAASSWFNRLEEVIFSLDQLPDRGARVAENQSLKQLFHGNKPHVYRVIYAIDHEARRVVVLHIRHGARDAFQREDLQ